MFEVDKAVNLITETVGEEANIIWGTVLDDSMDEELRVTVIATGFNSTQSNASNATPTARPQQQPQGTRIVGPDIPAFMRKTDSNDLDGEPKREGKGDEVSLDDLEYPTFLRRQMQKKDG